MGQRPPCLSGPIVSSVRQAGRIAAQAGLSLSADQKLPDQLCDGMTANHDSAAITTEDMPVLKVDSGAGGCLHKGIYNCSSAIVAP